MPADDLGYKGAQDAGSGASGFNALDFHIRRVIAEVSTATLVKIVKAPYDKDGNPIPPGTVGPIGYVDVLPLVNQLDGYGNPTQHQTVHKLKYHRYQGASGAIISDPGVGDVGKMVVADRDTSSVRANEGAQSNPGSLRRHDMADGTFFGSAIAKAPAQYLTFMEKGFNLTDAYGNTIVGTANGVLINGCLINQSGDVITKKGTDLDKHVHTGVTPGGGNTGPPA